MAARKKTLQFEQALEELETLVDDLENGDLPLDEALKAFEKGIQLTQQCQQRLTEAEQKVQLLVEQQDQLTSTPFDSDADASA